jgi:WD40 repeat protein
MIKEIKIPFGTHTNHIKCALILQNNNIAICGSYTTIKVFDLKKLKCMMKYKGHKQQINSLCLYGENEFLSCSDDRTVCRWLNTESNSLLDITKVKKGKKAKRDSLEYHRKEVLQLLQLDDSVALSCSEDGTIREWDFRVTKEKCTELLKLNDNEVPKVMIKINTKNIIIITNKNHLHIFNIEHKTLDKKVIQLPNDSIISTHSIKKIGPGKLLVGRKHGLSLFDLKSKMLLYEINNQPITTVQTFQILNPNSFICASAKKVYVYSLEDSSIIKTYEIDCIHKETPTCFAFVSFNRTLFSASSDSHIIKWKLTYT